MYIIAYVIDKKRKIIIPFKLGESGEIIVNDEYKDRIDDLIVTASLVTKKQLENLDTNHFYIIGGKSGRHSSKAGKKIR